jgi:hypothetical protein
VAEDWEVVQLAVEEQHDIVGLFETDEFMLLGEGWAVGEPIPDELHLLLLSLSVHEDRLMSAWRRIYFIIVMRLMRALLS